MIIVLIGSSIESRHVFKTIPLVNSTEQNFVLSSVIISASLRSFLITHNGESS
jgi:hypothetical protein